MPPPDSNRPRHTPLVSVVVPTFNRATLVSRAIDSALGQTYPNVEVIAVDDGSTDGTQAVLRELADGDDRLIVIGRRNGGPAAARNTGIERARGDYIAFLDSDDAWMPWKLELQVSCMESEPEIGMLWTDFGSMDEAGRPLEERYLRIMYQNIRNRRLGEVFDHRRPVADDAPRGRPDLVRIPLYSGHVYATMLLGSIVHTSTTILRRTVINEIGPFDESYRPNGEDYEFHLRTTRHTRVGFVDLPTARYRIGAPDQLSGTDHMVELAENFLRTVTDALESNPHPGGVPAHVERAVLSRAHSWLGQELLETGRSQEARRHLRQAWGLIPSWRQTRHIIVSHTPSFLRRLRAERQPAHQEHQAG